MAERYFFEDVSGNTLIEVDDGDYLVEGPMSANYSTGQCYLQFYDVDENPVTPSAGTITFKASPFEDDQWLGSSNTADTVNASDVEAGLTSYTTPKFTGCVIASKMTLDGITGAVYVRAFHWRE